MKKPGKTRAEVLLQSMQQIQKFRKKDDESDCDTGQGGQQNGSGSHILCCLGMRFDLARGKVDAVLNGCIEGFCAPDHADDDQDGCPFRW